MASDIFNSPKTRSTVFQFRRTCSESARERLSLFLRGLPFGPAGLDSLSYFLAGRRAHFSLNFSTRLMRFSQAEQAGDRPDRESNLFQFGFLLCVLLVQGFDKGFGVHDGCLAGKSERVKDGVTAREMGMNQRMEGRLHRET